MADQQTVSTYDKSAKELAAFMQGIGSHTEDIERALELAGYPEHACAVEIGCGDGRDARDITKYVDSYIGVDPSAGLLALAPKNIPNAQFVQADALSFTYPDNVNVVFAFASLLHSPKEELQEILTTVSSSLTENGVLYLELKERDAYERIEQTDRFGTRIFYYYTVPLIVEMSKGVFVKVYESHETIGSTSWFTLGLKKS